MSRLEDTALAVVQDVDRGDQRLEPVLLFVLFDDDGFRRGGLINEMVLPFADITAPHDFGTLIDLSPPSRRIHVDHILARNIKALCDQCHLIGVQVATFQCSDLAFRGAQFEEQLLLVRGGADLHK